MEPLNTSLALSTCWATKNVQNASEILDLLESAGLRRLELEYRFTTPVLAELLPLLKPRGFSVSSVHNFCPLPPEYPAEMASGDLFDFASPDPEERLKVVRYTIKSLELASDLETRAVVLHLGKPPMSFDRQWTKESAQQGHPTPQLLEAIKQRASLSEKVLDAVSFNLDKIIPRAESLGVVLGLENRYHATQVPTLEELEQLLERFEGAPLAPWLDLGHAQVKANAGLRPVEEWLQRLGDKLIGCHLHDVRDSRDHLPPGQGEVEFRPILKALKDVPIKVLELHGEPEAGQVRESVQYLQEAGLTG